MRPLPSWLLQRPIAHRGLHDRAAGRPDNSLAAFAAAAERGFPVELDVRLSRDGVVMVFHDDTLDRLSDLAGPFERYDARELQRTRIGGSQETIPTLRQVLDTIGGRVGIAVEVKSFLGGVGRCEELTYATMRAHGGDWIVQSFNPFSLAWFVRHAPEVTRGQISGPLAHWGDVPWSRWRCHEAEHYRTLWLSRPDFLCHDCQQLPHAAVDRLKAEGFPLTSYTVRNQATRDRLAGYVDNIIFEAFDPA